MGREVTSKQRRGQFLFSSPEKKKIKALNITLIEESFQFQGSGKIKWTNNLRSIYYITMHTHEKEGDTCVYVCVYVCVCLYITGTSNIYLDQLSHNRKHFGQRYQ